MMMGNIYFSAFGLAEFVASDGGALLICAVVIPDSSHKKDFEQIAKIQLPHNGWAQ